MDELRPVLDLLEPELGALEGEPDVLSGGITNRNLKARLGGRDYVLRICGEDTEVLSIDRETEVAATRAASDAGIAPEVVRWLPRQRVLVTRFLPGRAMQAAELRDPQMLATVAGALRRIHGMAPLATAFPTFTLVREYASAAIARGGVLPTADHAFALGLSDRIEAALRDRPGHELVTCHNDLLAANFLHSDGELRILDWEYAGMNDRYFDLGNFAVNNELSQEDEHTLLEAYLGEPADAASYASLRLMRLMSDVREAMWGVLQRSVSALDFDYGAYGAEHFARLRAEAADPRLEDWISAAAA